MESPDSVIWPAYIHEELCSEARKLMVAKCNDYASPTDPYKNFRMIESLHLGTMEQGIVVRMSDKLSRLAKFVSDPNLQVADEGVRDTIVDMINYSVILMAAVYERERLKQETKSYEIDFDEDCCG